MNAFEPLGVRLGVTQLSVVAVLIACAIACIGLLEHGDPSPAPSASRAWPAWLPQGLVFNLEACPQSDDAARAATLSLRTADRVVLIAVTDCLGAHPSIAHALRETLLNMLGPSDVSVAMNAARALAVTRIDYCTAIRVLDSCRDVPAAQLRNYLLAIGLARTSRVEAASLSGAVRAAFDARGSGSSELTELVSETVRQIEWSESRKEAVAGAMAASGPRSGAPTGE